MIKAYVRCSTSEDKQDLDRQVLELEKNYNIDKVYREYVSGSGVKRDQYDLMLSELTTGDSLIATEVSRLSRSTKQFIELLELVKDRGVRLVVGSMTIDCRSDEKLDIMTETTLKIMSVFSELEKQMTSERVKSGMENARAKGKKLGRPPVTREDVPRKFIDTYALYKVGKLNVTDLSKLNHISRTTVYKYIKLLKGEELVGEIVEQNETSHSGKPYSQYKIK